MKQRFLPALLAFCLAWTLLPTTAFAAGYSDVNTGAYYAAAVNWAVQNNITTGTGTNTFSPNESCTRGQMVTFLWRAAGEPEPAVRRNPFTDVNATDYYYKAVLWAFENNITTGTGANLFSPHDTCMRGQAAAFLWRASGKPETTGGSPFIDIKTTDYYYQAVLWAYQNGITTGTGGSTFSPGGICTRAQVVTFLYRAVGKLDTTLPDPELKPEPGLEPSIGTLPNGKTMTEENIQAILYGLKTQYPEGMRWTNANSYYSSALRMTGYGCEGFALICSDAVFGSLPLSGTHSDFSAIRVGDVLRVNNNTHVVVVLEKKENSVIVTEGNYNSSIHWGREISRQELVNGNFVARTRYPA